MGKTLGELMEKCEKKQYFCIEYEGLYDPDGSGDSSHTPDNEGHCLSVRLSYECQGESNVRVLINPEISKDNVIKLLDKIKKWIKKSDEWHNRAEERLKKIGNFNELQDMIQKVISEDYYTVEDIECAAASIKAILDKKRQEEKMPKDIVDVEMPFDFSLD